MNAFQKNQPRILNAWASYDWANSVYNLTITAAIFPVYYEAATREAFGGDRVLFFGWEVTASVLYAYAIGFSFILAAILSPLLSGLADYSGKKKTFMQFFTYMGAAACFTLYLFDGSNVELGVLAAIIASMGYSGAIVFYISYLPEIATDDRMDGVSAKGFSLGFLGSVIQLLISLIIIFQAENLGMTQAQATRLSFLAVGIWWIGFAQIAFFYLPKGTKQARPQGRLLTMGFKELNKVWQSLANLPDAKRFLISFFFYNMGAQTIFLLATLFGTKVLNLASDRLIATILLLQIVGIGGAYLFAYVSKRRGNKFALMSMLILWFLICGFGYFIQTELHFFIMAATFGVVMGGIHLSRSTYAKLIPENTTETTSYFSFYDVTEKVATALGPVSYGIIEAITGNMRFSLIALGIFFIVGISVLATVKVPRGEGSDWETS